MYGFGGKSIIEIDSIQSTNPPHPMLEYLKVAFSISRRLFSEEFWLDDTKGPISAVVVEGIQLGCWVKIVIRLYATQQLLYYLCHSFLTHRAGDNIDIL